jgi:hypothetical protein
MRAAAATDHFHSTRFGTGCAKSEAGVEDRLEPPCVMTPTRNNVEVLPMFHLSPAPPSL